MTRPPDPGPATAELTVHATGLVWGEAGIVIRGEPGAGKSSLALDLLDRAERAGTHARLVGDDRLHLGLHHGRIVARPHPALSGRIEIRGSGIRRLVHHAPAMVVRLVVDLVETRPRLPEGPDEAELLGLRLPALVLERHGPRAYLVVETLRGLDGDVASRTHPAALWPGRPDRP